MPANAAVTVDTTAGGVTVADAASHRVELIFENSSSGRVHLRPSAATGTLSTTLYTISLAQYEKVSLTGNAAKIAWKGVVGASTSSLMRAEVYNNDQGV